VKQSFGKTLFGKTLLRKPLLLLGAKVAHFAAKQLMSSDLISKSEANRLLTEWRRRELFENLELEHQNHSRQTREKTSPKLANLQTSQQMAIHLTKLHKANRSNQQRIQIALTKKTKTHRKPATSLLVLMM